jgi:hypothetical protein
MIYELRHYVPHEGKREALKQRFATGTLALFRKVNINVTDFWEAPDTGDLWYIVEWPDRQTMKLAWDAFRDNPDWLQLKAKTEIDGPLTSITSIVLERPDFFRQGRPDAGARR